MTSMQPSTPQEKPGGILLVAETIENRLQPSVADLLAAAVYLRSLTQVKTHLVVAGGLVEPAARGLAQTAGLDAVTALQHPLLALPDPDLLAAALLPLIQGWKPDFILLPHSTRACLTAARIAHSLRATCISAVEDLRLENGRCVARRALFNGRFTGEVAAAPGPVVLTIQSGSFARVRSDAPAQPAVFECIEPDLPEPKTRTLALTATIEKDQAVEAADTVVSAGRGIGGQENLDLIRATAGIFKNSCIAGSRTVCDLGWLPYSRQIGETGRRIAPRLYLACGISGARQHTAGIGGAQTVIAVNSDPKAAIFAVADIGIVEDLTTFLPLMLHLFGK